MKFAVYCSSRQGLDTEYIELAHSLGEWIGEQGHALIYGGVNAGLMHEAAQACHDAGGHITGVNIEAFKHRTDPLVDEVIYTANLGERKARMYQMANAFVVLPGGLGTVDEWISTLSQLVVDGDDRPIIVVNVHGMYDSLLQYLEEMARSPFSRDAHLQRLRVVDTAQQMIDCLNQISSEKNEK
jgi:uncharacterized protein (TIGR00730 family)